MRRRSVFAIAVWMVLISGLEGSTIPTPPPGFLDAFAWSTDDPLFGGLSALEVSEDGLGLVVLSDKGNFTRARVRRDAENRILRIDADGFDSLKGADGTALRPGQTDSEGLAMAADGQFFVSFEGPAMIRQYAGLGASAGPIPDAPEFGAMADNRALEALAIAADGTLYTLGEGPDGPFALLRYRGGIWDSPLSIRQIGNFLPVGADIGPDGRLYLLERQFLGLSGFASRLRRFALDETGLTDGTILLQTAPGTHDNLEGLSIWRNAKGGLMASMVSDDNFLPVLATEIVEYHLPD